LGKRPQEGDATHELEADDPTAELEMLEQTISIEGARELRHDAHGLVSAPIPRSWVLEGNPVARDKRLTGGVDRLPSTLMWDCTAGRFNWFYQDEEVAHVLEGSVVIEDTAGVRQWLRTGDTFLFPAGSQYLWTVPNYIRKIAFSYSPPPREMRLINGVVERLTGPFRRKPPGAGSRDS
jgi:uncharacterized cupin superfamily protein